MEIHSGKKFRTLAERRQIVEETLKPGTSVSAVARAHDVNTNQVYSWRRQYREGWLEEKRDEPTALVPVKISAAVKKAVRATRRELKFASRPVSGSIDIELGHARMRIEGAADPECIRAALEGLLR
jgi:transposase